MKRGTYLFVLSLFLAFALSFQLPVLAQENASPFSRSSPEDVGMSSERLRHVVNTVQEWVNNDEIVGAVMLVIRHDKVVLHEAVGWNDREKNIPMEVGTIVQLRSMAKPLTGSDERFFFFSYTPRRSKKVAGCCRVPWRARQLGQSV